MGPSSLRRRPGTRVVAVLSSVVTVCSLTAGPATAASTIGSTFDPPTSCAFPYTYVQTTSPTGTTYAVTTGGVITRWYFQAAVAAVPRLEFKVFRPTGGGSYQVVGSSEPEQPQATYRTSYPIRVPVIAGDLIGFTTLSAGKCSDSAEETMATVPGDAEVGSNLSYSAGPGTLDISADLEPDSDDDGYGDETQELAPETGVNDGPERTYKRKVKLLFGSTPDGATFECRLAGAKVNKPRLKTYRPCTSPWRYKNLKPGRYTFFVRGTGPSGNVDQTPATWKFKIQSKP
jgi:hypothetical protein